MTTPRTNENRNGLRFRNAALCAAFGALSAMSFIVSGENYQGISDPPASSASQKGHCSEPSQGSMGST